jgi:hypothetical protein
MTEGWESSTQQIVLEFLMSAAKTNPLKKQDGVGYM